MEVRVWLRKHTGGSQAPRDWQTQAVMTIPWLKIEEEVLFQNLREEGRNPPTCLSHPLTSLSGSFCSWTQLEASWLRRAWDAVYRCQPPRTRDRWTITLGEERERERITMFLKPGVKYMVNCLFTPGGWNSLYIGGPSWFWVLATFFPSLVNGAIKTTT